jgi:epsilon-lactone hydrolase
MQNSKTISAAGAIHKFELDQIDIAPGRRLRTSFARFWSEPFGDMRSKYDEFVALTPCAKGVTFRETNDPASGWWAETPDAPSTKALFFIHGGGYGLGSAKAYRNFVSHLASLTRINVFSLDYPLAPEATLPCSLEMAVDAINRFQEKYDTALVGDSAGGGMTLAATARLTASHTTPAAVAVFSPWTDLTLSGTTMRSMAIGDISLDPEYLRQSAGQYLGSRSATHADASPLFGIPVGMPPTLIQVGTDEVLLDDSVRYAQASAGFGNDIRLEVYEGMHHVFVLNLAELATARRALERASDFLAAHLV